MKRSKATRSKVLFAESLAGLIFFSFYLPKGAHAGGYGTITRVVQVTRVPSTYHYGVRFTDLDSETRDAIAASSGR